MVPFLNIPVLSVVLMLLAGILIGHLIWYRDRSDDQAALFGLRGENQDLQGALHKHKQAYVELESELDVQGKEWDRLKTAHKELEFSRQDMEHDLAKSSAELARLQQLKDQAFHDLDQERQQRRSLQDALGKEEEVNAEVQAAAEQLQRQVATFQADQDAMDQGAHAKLHQQGAIIDQLTIERDTARQEATDTQSTLARQQTELDAQTSDLHSLQEDRDELHQQLDDERLTREQLQLKMRQVEQLVALRDEALAKSTRLESRLEEIQEKITSQQQVKERLEQAHGALIETHETLQREFDALNKEYESVSSALVDERGHLSQMEAENARLTVSTARRDVALRQEQDSREAIAKLQYEAETRNNDLETLRNEFAETATKLGRERHQRDHLQHVLKQRNAEIEQLSQAQGELELLRAEKEKTHTSLSTQTEKIQALDQQCEAVKQELEVEKGAHSKLRESASEISTQNRHLAEQAEILMALRGEHESAKRMLEDKLTETQDLIAHREAALRSCREAEAMIAELEQHVETLNVAHTEQNAELLQLHDNLSDHGDVKRSLGEQSERLEKILAQRDEAINAQSTLDQVVRELQEQFDEKDHSLSSLNQQYSQVTQQLALEEEKQRDTSKSLEAQINTVSQLEEQLRARESLHEETLQLQTTLTETTDELQRVTSERDRHEATAAGVQRRIDQLESKARASENTIRNLRRERGAVFTRERQAVSVAFAYKESSIEDATGGRLRRDEVLGMVYTQPPKRKDDLKEISGIAEVLERKLNAFGVYTYRQIMDWDSVAVEEFSKLLSFRERIERDDWVGQARSLHLEHYGRAA